MSNSFTSRELARYSRHLNLPNFTVAHQLKLKHSKVLIVGAGGLGSPVSLYLAAAGIGTLGVVDFDEVEESNLQRQILFDTSHIGSNKAVVAAQRIKSLNPFVEVKIYTNRLDSSNALDIIKEYDIVADGTDNFATRYLVNDACVLLGKPNVYASIFRFEGQASVFNLNLGEGSYGPNYRDLFPSPPPPGLVPSCAEGGVFGVLPGILGSIQANEVIKIAAGIGIPLSGRLLLMDTLEFQTRFLNIKKRSDNPLTGENPIIHNLIDYDEFCAAPTSAPNATAIPTMEVEQLKELLKQDQISKFVDVREPYEKEITDLGGVLIPQDEIEENLGKIPKTGKVVFYCRSGKRSEEVVRMLINKYHYSNIYNLSGGVLRWIEKVDASLTKY